MKQNFMFTEKNKILANNIIDRYPDNKKNSAIMPLLTLAQKQNNNYISDEVVEYIANFLNIPSMEVMEVVHFYSMYNTKPVGKYHFQLCNSISCLIVGSEKIYDYLYKIMEIEKGNISKDGKFSIKKVECLGACVNAVALKMNDFFIDDISKANLDEIVNNLKKDLPISLNRSVKKPIFNI